MSIDKAGGVIRRNTERGIEVLCIHRSRYNDWSLPKGHVEPSEELEAAALREVLEETGLVCRVTRQLPLFAYTLPNGQPSTVAFFEMEVIAQDLSKKDTEADKLLWCTFTECEQVLSYSALKEYLRATIFSD